MALTRAKVQFGPKQIGKVSVELKETTAATADARREGALTKALSN